MKSIAPAHLPHDRSLGEEEGAAIVVRDLSKAFDGRVVLDRVSCTVPAGQFVVLLGPSGCGKSTLFRCLTRLVEPDAGSVTIRGTEVTALKPAAL